MTYQISRELVKRKHEVVVYTSDANINFLNFLLGITLLPTSFGWLCLSNLSPLTGTGEETRDFTFIEDIVDGTLRMGVIKEKLGEAKSAIKAGLKKTYGLLREN